MIVNLCVYSYNGQLIFVISVYILNMQKYALSLLCVKLPNVTS